MTCAYPEQSSIDWIFAAGQARFSYFAAGHLPADRADQRPPDRRSPGHTCRTDAGRLRRIDSWVEQRRHADWQPLPPTGAAGLSLLGASLYGVLRAEATLARRAIGTTDGRVPDATGWYGRGRPGPAIKIALLGDSSAAGLRRATASSRHPAPGWARASPSAPTGGCTCASSPWSAPSPATWHRRSTRRPAHRPRRRGDPDRRQRRHPHGAAGGVGAAPLRGRTPPAGGRRRGGRRHLPRPRHHLAAPAAAAPGGPGRGRAGWPPRRPSRSSRPAAAPSRSARSSGRSSPPHRPCSSGPTSSTPPPPATRPWPGCWCPRCSPPSGWARRARRRRGSDAARPCCRSATPRSRPARTPAPRSTAPRSAAPSAAWAVAGSR